ncbi:hypothetical protein GCM10027562_11410 [Arthrobacter pigmenti]
MDDDVGQVAVLRLFADGGVEVAGASLAGKESSSPDDGSSHTTYPEDLNVPDATTFAIAIQGIPRSRTADRTKQAAEWPGPPPQDGNHCCWTCAQLRGDGGSAADTAGDSELPVASQLLGRTHNAVQP